MEPFIIEEFLVFVLVVAGLGLVVFFLIRLGLSRSAVRRQEHDPRQRIARIIGESESRLTALRGNKVKLEPLFARLQAATALCRAQREYWGSVEAGGPHLPQAELKAAVRQRLEAEAGEKLAATAEDTARKAIGEIERSCADLERQIALARVAQASLEARMAAAHITRDIHDDLGDGAAAALDELEQAAAICEARADACVATSRHFEGFRTAVTDEDVAATMKSRQKGAPL